MPTPRARRPGGEGQEAILGTLGASGAPKRPGVVSETVRALLGAQRSKYGNRKVTLAGYTFDSQAESRRYLVLRARLAAGEIIDLEVHPGYRLEVNGVLICRYVADFAYHDPETYAETVEDVKSAATRTLPVYRLKARLMLACLGITVQEIREV
jgi:hypothetical protein